MGRCAQYMVRCAQYTSTFTPCVMSVCLSVLVLSDSTFFTFTIVAKAIFTIFDSITIVHFSLIDEI